jgi:hypothetical protein
MSATRQPRPHRAPKPSALARPLDLHPHDHERRRLQKAELARRMAEAARAAGGR